MIPALVVAALVLAALAFILAPLMRGTETAEDSGTSPTDEAEARKRAAFSALVDIETEHEIGKLSASDFELLRSEYEREALAALKELDSLGGVQPADDELEAEIEAMKSRLSCPTCGELRTPGKPCSKCGIA